MTAWDVSVDVVITGAGMVGLTLANLLCKQGKSVAVIDRSQITTFENDRTIEARVTAVSPGSQAIFEYVNAWQHMQAKRVLAFTKMHVWDEAGEAAIDFSADAMQTDNLGHIVENLVIQTSLHEALQQQSNVEWLLMEQIKKVIIHQSHAEVTLRSGKLISTKLVVGADGSRSAIRNLAGISFLEKSYQQMGLVALVETEQPHQHTAWQRFLSTGPLALLPLDNDQCSIVWSVSEDYADELMKLNEYEFADALTQASAMQLGNITLKSKCVAFPLVSGQADSMVQPRIALVGDAAHALHPLAGQGANIGFTDAAVLADVIASTDRDIGGLKVLRKYERARVGETQIMQKAMDGFVAAFGSSNKAIISARNAALRTADSLKPIKKFFMKHAMGLSKDRPTFAR
ncbi:MAG: UbiH/UbiF/VisC/COQ6 family ubiquinone biosynthesis hydroxylase [Pseudomonadota bacterium]